jgi:hypothetical protein
MALYRQPLDAQCRVDLLQRERRVRDQVSELLVPFQVRGSQPRTLSPARERGLQPSTTVACSFVFVEHAFGSGNAGGVS